MLALQKRRQIQTSQYFVCKAHEIQERLIKNKRLLNAVEPTLERPHLEVVLGILQRRIGLDKEVLFQFNQLKKEFDLPMAMDHQPGSGAVNSVAPLLMKYQRGCQQVGSIVTHFFHPTRVNEVIAQMNKGCNIN